MRLTDEQVSNLYSTIYSTATSKGLYGAVNRRAPLFINRILKTVPSGGTILDAGCGRGLMLRWLRGLGYIVDGTEIADWLMLPGGDLCGLGVKKLYYSELDTIPDASYDAVVSNDVLEHLQSEDEIFDSLRHLVRISKKEVLLSTGGTRAAANPCRTTVVPPVSNLHFVVRPEEWWKLLYESYCTLQEDFLVAGSYFLFGVKK